MANTREDLKTDDELTEEERTSKAEFAARGVNVEYSKKPWLPNMKYHDYLAGKEEREL